MADQAERLRTSYLDSNDHKARVITITSGKGGVGKTNVAVNLALALAQLGKNVVIFDADLGLANVDILLGLIPIHTMHQVVNGDKKLLDIILTAPGGIRIVPGSTGIMEMGNLNEFQRQQLLTQLLELEKTTDIIIIDTGAGLSKSVMGFVTAADDVILITNPEPTSITDAYAIAKIIGKYRLQKEVKLIVNQVDSMKEGEMVAERFSQVAEKYIRLPVEYLGYVVSDRAVSRSVREQNPFYLAYPNSKAARCITAIANNLLKVSVDQSQSSNGIKKFFLKLAKLYS